MNILFFHKTKFNTRKEGGVFKKQEQGWKVVASTGNCLTVWKESRNQWSGLHKILPLKKSTI